MTTYKKGDRVKITYVREGEVVDVDGVRIWFQDDKLPMLPAAIYPISEVYAKIEKLADPVPPEPIWVNGDLVKAGGGIYVYSRGLWRHTGADAPGHRNLISNYWLAGKLEILYKADAEKKVA